MAQARAAGFPAERLGIVADTPEALADVVRRNAGRIDVFGVG